MLEVLCITLRENMELVETIHESWNKLVVADEDQIISAINGFILRTAQRNGFSKCVIKNI